MDIASYLAEIEHAARETTALIWAEHRQVEELHGLVQRLTAEAEDGYRRAAAWREAEDPDDVMLGVGLQWETYFGADKERHGAQNEVERAKSRLDAREFSRASMAGNLLQYAKQGISIVHSSLAACPEGRLIGSQPLKQVIWQARNQALHWEEGKPHPPVKQCFDLLSAEIGQQFAPYVAQNLAFEVVALLGWVDYEAFATDLQSLA